MWSNQPKSKLIFYRKSIIFKLVTWSISNSLEKAFITITAPGGVWKQWKVCYMTEIICKTYAKYVSQTFCWFQTHFCLHHKPKIKLALTEVITLEKLLIIVGKTWVNIIICIIMIDIATILICKTLFYEKILLLIVRRVFNELD